MYECGGRIEGAEVVAIWEYSRAIKTTYNSIEYRSRLEAAWASRFDSLGIKFIYEPEQFTFELQPGWGDKPIHYTPDFLLVEANCYIELKFSRADDSNIAYMKCSRLSELGHTVMMIRSTHKLRCQVTAFYNGVSILERGAKPLTFEQGYQQLMAKERVK